MVSTLLITEAGVEGGLPEGLSDAYRIVLDFSAAGDACAVPGSAGPPNRFVLGADWRRIRARFAPFALVRSVVAHLLRERPQRVVVDPLSGASLELARLAAALGFEVVLRLPDLARVDPADAAAMRWLHGLLVSAAWLLPARRPGDEAALRQYLPDLASPVADPLPPAEAAPGAGPFGYEAYALGRRDHALLLDMQAGFVRHFADCAKVLDLGCGTGVFLELLARRGITARGVERNRMSEAYARSLGHEVVCADALAFLESGTDTFDGVYCSHFIEHLPVDAAERLLGGVARVLNDGGVALFVFPDPESIRSQLLGFWRDPEHVRFYHPELVELLAGSAGLQLISSSLDAPGRQVVPFAMQPPPQPARPAVPGRWGRILGRLGIASAADLAAERARADATEMALRQLWAVNQTWAWDDNAVLCFRKPASGGGGV
jgi:SAM-dependent methyltransferase